MSCTVTGVPELISDLKRISVDGARYANAIVGSVADMIVADAKINAPADLGAIRQMIAKDMVVTDTGAIATINANAPESPFQEFGTGGKVDVPTEMQDVASEFKGASGGDFAAFVLALTGWVKRHGINPIGAYQVSTRKRIGRGNKRDLDETTAYLIARSILKNGLKPQPFLYPAYVKNIVKLIPMLEKAFTNLQFQYTNAPTPSVADSEFY